MSPTWKKSCAKSWWKRFRRLPCSDCTSPFWKSSKFMCASQRTANSWIICRIPNALPRRQRPSVPKYLDSWWWMCAKTLTRPLCPNTLWRKALIRNWTHWCRNTRSPPIYWMESTGSWIWFCAPRSIYPTIRIMSKWIPQRKWGLLYKSPKQDPKFSNSCWKKMNTVGCPVSAELWPKWSRERFCFMVLSLNSATSNSNRRPRPRKKSRSTNWRNLLQRCWNWNTESNVRLPFYTPNS